MPYLLGILGLAFLFVGARWLIRGASSLGKRAGLSPVVIGLTVVAFGTSTPELGVSVIGAWTGQLDLALGNVIGSNIFNVLMILGLSAALVPLVVHQRILQYDVPLNILVSLVCFGFAWNGHLARWEGILLVLGLILYTIWALGVLEARPKGSREGFTHVDRSPGPVDAEPGLFVSGLMLVVGLVLLIAGSRLFSGACASIARSFGVPEIIIGLTIVSAGTSLPEVGTSVMAALQGETDIAVGNVMGSNLFNLTGVLGTSVLVSPGGLPVSSIVLEFDFVILILVAIVCLPLFFTEHRISRWEGLLFVIFYALYLLSMVGPHAFPWLSRTLSTGLLVFLVPLAAVTVGVGVYRQWRTGG